MAGLLPLYRAEPQHLRLIEVLDEMTLVYQRRSGITHIVTEPVPQMLHAMGEDALNAEQLLSRLAADFDIGPDDQALSVITARLEELVSLGLVKKVRDA
jgi:PqqD family protein of HPr-rel-A system